MNGERVPVAGITEILRIFQMILILIIEIMNQRGGGRDLGTGAEVVGVPGEGITLDILDDVPILTAALATQENPEVILEVEADGEEVDREVGSSRTAPELSPLTSSLLLNQKRVQQSNFVIISRDWPRCMVRTL